ncbi:hypothetical protein [Deinococcus sp. UYEF24]
MTLTAELHGMTAERDIKETEMKLNFATYWTLPIACLITLTACQGTASLSITRTSPLEVTKVVLPESVGASDAMIVDLTVLESCTETVPDIVAERTASALRLTVQRTTTVTNPAPCPPVVFYVKKTYTDPSNLFRTNLFEVFVNGKSYGTVALK